MLGIKQFGARGISLDTMGAFLSSFIRSNDEKVSFVLLATLQHPTLGPYTCSTILSRLIFGHAESYRGMDTSK